MRQSYYQIRFPSPTKLLGLKRSYLSPQHKSPHKLLSKEHKLPRNISPPSYISTTRSPQHSKPTVKLAGSPPKYVSHVSPSRVKISVSKLHLNKDSLSQQTTHSSRTMSQLEIIKESHQFRNKNIEYDLSAIGSETSDLPRTIKQQPNFMLFLCTNCYQYFMLPERAVHTTTCTFVVNEHEINTKINKIIQILKIIETKHPHRFIKAVISKLEQYQQRTINMEDILLFEMLIVKSDPHPDLNWNELFWVIKELIKMKERLKMEKMSKTWMFCT